MSKIGEPEIRQACKRYFRKLLQGCILLPRKGGGYAVSRPGANAEKARMRLSADLAREFLNRGFLSEAPNGLSLSAAGKAYYKTLMHPEANPYGAQHQSLKQTEIRNTAGQSETVTVNIRESPLTYLHQRHLINQTEFDAGELLRRDFTLARLSPRLSMDWSHPIHRGGRAGAGTLSDTVLDAKDRFSKALVSAGPEFSNLLYDVCCDLTGLEAIEKRMGWPRASAKVVLRLGLDRLARHYGLGVSRRHAKIAAWSTPAAKNNALGEEMVGGEGFEPPTPSV